MILQLRGSGSGREQNELDILRQDLRAIIMSSFKLKDKQWQELLCERLEMSGSHMSSLITRSHRSVIQEAWTWPNSNMEGRVEGRMEG
jgi:hypothetical protein